MTSPLHPGDGPVPAKADGRRVYRHSLVVRLAHWLNALCLTVLFMSGLQIFNAHPALYWGETSNFEAPLMAIKGDWTDEGQPIGTTTLFGRSFETTGVLGWSRVRGELVPRTFPNWMTIPSGQDLATARVWHFFFAWLLVFSGFAYLCDLLARRRLTRDLWPSRQQLRSFGATLGDHLRLRFHREERYNVLQKLAYLAVILLILPMAVLTGLTMSPGFVTAAPWLLDLFGGRQSARTLHFVLAWSLAAFVVAHLAMLAVSGFWRKLGAMITGWYAVEPERDGAQ